jgi:hypothetical protein
MIRIKIFSSFCSSEECKKKFEKVYNSKRYDFYGENKEIFITTEDDYTHAIILNNAMPDLKVSKENVVGLAFEPLEFLGITNDFILYAKKNIGKYLIGKKENLPDLFVEHFSFLWHNNPWREIHITEKKNIMSIVFSSKNLAPGHIYRLNLVKQILDEKLPIDIYGTGCSLLKKYYPNYTSFKNIKGTFNSNEPYISYLYTVCIENYESNDYFSEKILDALFHNCSPIYFGAKNIDNYFNNIIKLKGNQLFDIEMLKVILKKPEKYYRIEYNERNLSRINFFENIKNNFLFSSK